MSALAPTSPVLTVSSLTSGTLSNADGLKLLLALKDALSEQSGPVTLDLTGVISFSSSFLNSSFGSLFEDLGVDSFKRLRLSNYKPAQAKMIKEYMADVAQNHHA